MSVKSGQLQFYEHGYDGTSFSHIVEASGLYRGNIYHYFKTKDDILKAVIDLHLKEFGELLARWDQEFTDPKEKLIAFVDMLTGRKAELVQYGCPIGSMNMELGKGRRDLQKPARALFDLFRDWLAGCFKEMGKDDKAKSLALHLLGRAQGITVIAHVYQDPKLLRRETTNLQTWIRNL
ncbi:MAG: TetR/AcrR family transcriptional regulator [Gallionellaceae bacterium]|nr:TetR/AcrR family transcriptional regulator [Gallionellaceae bacterium]